MDWTSIWYGAISAIVVCVGGLTILCVYDSLVVGRRADQFIQRCCDPVERQDHLLC
jgi:hypothetical protein